MHSTVELLEQAEHRDDAAILWRAVKAATAAESRALRERFHSTYVTLDDTQKAMFRSYVTIHGSTLDRDQRALASATVSS